MTLREFIEMLDELIAVETDDLVVKKTRVDKNKITITLRDETEFVLTIEEGWKYARRKNSRHNRGSSFEFG